MGMWKHHHQRLPRHWAIVFRKRSPFTFTAFQWKYTVILLFSSTVSVLLAWIPAYFFLDQNYRYFTELAYSHAPQLLRHLEREQVWLNSLFLAIFVAVSIFSLVFGSRVSGRIIFPLLALENHIKSLIRGKWYSSELKIRETDEFNSLISLYNYFFRFLILKTKEEIKILKSIESLNIPDDARIKLRDLIKKQEGLLKHASDHVSSDVQSRDERLAS